MPQKRNSHNRSSSLPTTTILGSAESTPDLGSIAGHIMTTLPKEYANLAADETHISSPLSFVSYQSLTNDSPSKPFLPAISTSDPFSFPTQFLSPLESGYALPTSPTDAGDRSSGGWWDVVSAVESDGKPPWQRSNNSLSLSAFGSSPAKSHAEMQRGLSDDCHSGAIAMLPPGAAPAMVRSPSNGLRLEESMEGYAPMQLGESVLPTGSTGHTPRLGNVSSPVSQRQSPVASPSMQSIGSFAYDQPGTTSSLPFTPDTSPRSRPPPVPIMIDRPSFPSPQSDRASSTPGGPQTPNSGISTSPIKGVSKLASFSRTMSMARVRKREKERNASVDWSKEESKHQPMNDPGKWNKDMVASIMGQPNR